MVFYDFECKKCEVTFDKMWNNIPKNPPQTSKCPKCGERSKRVLRAVFFKVDGGWQDKLRNKGHSLLKDEQFAKEFASTHYDATVRRMETAGAVNYSRYDYNPNKDLRREGDRPRRCSDSEIKEKLRKAKELTIDSHKMSGKLNELGDNCKI